MTEFVSSFDAGATVSALQRDLTLQIDRAIRAIDLSQVVSLFVSFWISPIKVTFEEDDSRKVVRVTAKHQTTLVYAETQESMDEQVRGLAIRHGGGSVIELRYIEKGCGCENVART